MSVVVYISLMVKVGRLRERDLLAYDKDKYIAIEAPDGEWFLISRVEFEIAINPSPERRFSYYTISDMAIVKGSLLGVTAGRLGLSR